MTELERYAKAFGVPVEAVEEIDCTCPCHNPDVPIIHFMPCCDKNRKVIQIKPGFDVKKYQMDFPRMGDL